MPVFTMRYVNRSNPGASQDWNIGGIIRQDFTLQPNYEAGGQLTITNNGTILIAVDSESRFAAASLVYTAATNTWTLDSQTPNEFQLQVAGVTVTVRCLLTDAADFNDASFVPGQPRAAADVEI